MFTEVQRVKVSEVVSICIATVLAGAAWASEGLLEVAGQRQEIVARTLVPSERSELVATSQSEGGAVAAGERTRGESSALRAYAQRVPQALIVDAQPGFATRSAPACGPLLLAPALYENFEHLNDTAGSTPPNPVAAVGPNHVVGAVNRRLRIKERDGDLLLNIGINTFFGAAASTFNDPQLLYDRVNDRFIALASADANSASSRAVLAVSAGSNPTAAWHLLTLDADASNLLTIDDARVGGNEQLIIVTANMYTISTGAFAGVQMWAIDKTSALDGGGTVSWNFLPGFDIQPDTTRGFSMVPAEVVQSSRAGEPVFCIENNWGEGGNQFIRVSSVALNGTGATWSRWSGPASVGNGLWQLPTISQYSNTIIPGSQPNSAVKLNPGDARIRDVVQRGGGVWFAWHGGAINGSADDHTKVVWSQIAPYAEGSTIFASGGSIDEGPGTACMAPNIAVNCAGDIALAFTRSSSTRFAEASYVVRRVSAGSDGVQTLRPGLAPYKRGLVGTETAWSRSSGAVVDPLNDTSFWIASSYAEQTLGPGNNDTRWGTWWGRVGTIDGTGCEPVWTRVEPVPSPSGRAGQAMAYDAMRGRVLLFGGQNNAGNKLADLWHWTGAQWTRIFESGGPAARSNHRMVSDPATGNLYMFGGTLQSGALSGELWRFDGSQWTLLSNQPTIARREFAMAFDSARNAVVIFGGADSSDNSLGDIRIFSLTTNLWTSGLGGPSARRATTMAYDASRQRIVLVGGLANFVALSDTWEWNGTSWSQRTPTNPAPPTHATTLEYDPSVQRVVMYGGKGQETTRATRWEYDGVTWREYYNLAPIDRKFHGFCYDAGRNVYVVHAGEGPNGVMLEDTWELRVDASDRAVGGWKPMAGSGPVGREEPVGGWDPVNEVIWMWGGLNPANTESLRESWVWSGCAWGRASVHGTVVPSARSRTAMAWVPGDVAAGTRQGMLLYGGFQPNAVELGDRWLLDTAGRWTALTNVVPTEIGVRSWHTMTPTYTAQGVVMVAGVGRADCWMTKDGVSWQLRAAPPSFALSGSLQRATGVASESSNSIVLTGGLVGNQIPSNYTFTYYPASNLWQVSFAAAPSPTARSSGRMAFLSNISAFTYLRVPEMTLWQWLDFGSNGQFQQLGGLGFGGGTLATPLLVESPRGSGSLLLFGGLGPNGQYPANTHVLRGSNALKWLAPYPPTVTASEYFSYQLGSVHTLSATNVPQGATVEWRRINESGQVVALTDERFVGENTPTLTINGVTAEDVKTWQFNSFRGPRFEAIVRSACGTPQAFAGPSVEIRLLETPLPINCMPFNVQFSGLSNATTGTATGPTDGDRFARAPTSGNLVRQYSGGGSTGSGFDSVAGLWEAFAEVSSSGEITTDATGLVYRLAAGGSWSGYIRDTIPNTTTAYANLTMGSLSYVIDFPVWAEGLGPTPVRVLPGTYRVTDNIGVAVSTGGARQASGGFSRDLVFYPTYPQAVCDPIDFNNNSLFPEDQDLIDLLSVLAGGPCSNDPPVGTGCNDIDFNNDGLFPSDDDLIAYLRVFAGGDC